MSIFQRIFSSSNQRYLNKINKIVQLANELEASYKELNDDEFLSLKSLIIKDYSENNDLLTAHAFAALNNLDLKKDEIVVINLSGRGDKDLNTLMKYV